PELRPSKDPDYDLPANLGHFFTQTDGQAGATGNGYVVTDLGDIPFWTYFKNSGGKERFGYPVSDRFEWNGFIVQAFQKVGLQWRPEVGTFFVVNVFDEMHNQGKDAFLESARSVPQPADTSPDTGLTWEQVVARHYAFMDSDDDIKATFFQESDPLNLNGLPVAPNK